MAQYLKIIVLTIPIYSYIFKAKIHFVQQPKSVFTKE